MDSISNKATKALDGKLKFVGPGVAQGRLYAISTKHGYYPAYIEDDDNSYSVKGVICKPTKNFMTSDLNDMDEYEEYYKDDILASEYIRKNIKVYTSMNELLEVTIYTYRRDITKDIIEITSGDFMDFIKINKLKTFHEE